MPALADRSGEHVRLDNMSVTDLCWAYGASPSELFHVGGPDRRSDTRLRDHASCIRAVRRDGSRHDRDLVLDSGTGATEGLVVAGDPYVVSGRERRDYQLTPAGRLVLADEAARLARASRVVGARLKATGALAT